MQNTLWKYKQETDVKLDIQITYKVELYPKSTIFSYSLWAMLIIILLSDDMLYILFEMDMGIYHCIFLMLSKIKVFNYHFVIGYLRDINSKMATEYEIFCFLGDCSLSA